MANLTLVIDDEVLRRARIRALEQGTSVNAIVREQLERYAAADDTVRAAMSAIVKRARSSHSGSGPGGRTWTRDSLYDR